MSLKQYKNKADILIAKASIEGHRWSPEDYSLLITEKVRAFEDPADQTIDYAVEMHVYTPDGDWLAADHRLETAKIPPIVARHRFLQLNVKQELEELGIERGSYKLVFNFIKNLLGNTENRSVFIKEISPNRKEVWLTLADSLSTEMTPDDDIKVTLSKQYNQFKRYTNKKYNKGCSNLVLNLGSNNIFKIVNARIGGITSNEELGETRLGSGQNIYLKLYDALPTDIVEKQRAWISQEDKRPYIESINVYPEVIAQTFTPIQGPNFEIDHDYAMKTETDFQSWNELLDTTTSTTQQIVDRYFSGSLSGINLNINYSKFDNFIKYSSAEERLKNFRYKLQLVEYYDEQLGILSNALGSDSGSLKGNESINTKRKNEVIGGFDAFERWAYNEPTASIFTHGVTGSTLYAQPYVLSPYPKYIENGDYKLHHSTSSLGTTWLNGFITSGSLYDLENEDSLINSIPENIAQDVDNDQYLLFVNMIGHHYDILFSYINELTRMHRTEEHPKEGVPGELLYDVAKSMGWNLANGNQAESLWQYKLGKTVSGSYQSTGSMSSKSSEDISHEIWRRIVNNLPYILKTKGTKRSVHALMNTYGIPKTLLSIREYGGPKAPEQEPDLIEDKFSYALQVNPGARIKLSNDQVTGISNVHGTAAEIPVQTHQLRFKPGMTSSMHIMSRVYDANNVPGNEAPNWTVALQHTASYSGSSKYGRLHFGIVAAPHALGGASASMTEWLPIYDGNFWNMQIGYTTTGIHFNSGSNTDTTYTLHVQHAADYIKGKVVHSDSTTVTPTTGSHFANWGMGGTNRHIILGGSTGSNGTAQNNLKAAISASFGVISSIGKVSVTNRSGNPGIYPGDFSGSLQEYRAWTEEIDKATFDIHTLNPTSYVGKLSPTSSYDTLITHYPLGSDTIAFDHSIASHQIISSSHPNQTWIGADNSLPYGDGYNTYASASGFNTPTNTQRGNYQRLVETYYIDAPSIGGTNTNSTKIRIEDQKLVGRLDPESMAERSRYDYATLDSNRLGLFYSSADQINKDIYNQIGAISLDNYFGDPSDEFNNEYPELESIAQEYWKKYTNRNDINAYIKIFSLFDFSLFTQIKQLIPARADSAMGVLVEPNVLERAKVQLYKQPVITNPQYEQRISVAIHDLSGKRNDYTASLDLQRMVTSSMVPLKDTIGIERNITSSIVPLKASLNADLPITSSMSPLKAIVQDTAIIITGSMIKFFSTGSLEVADISKSGVNISQSAILSHVGNRRQRDATYLGQINVSYSSSIAPSDYLLKSWHHRQTIRGYVYSGSVRNMEQPVIVTNYALGTEVGSNITEVDYDRNQTASSAIQTVILEQRKSYIYKKKEFFYTPKDKAARHYPLDRFYGTSSTILDSTDNYQHSKGYIKTAHNSSTETALDPALARFDEVTHNNFTGKMLIFDCYEPQSDTSRGSSRIVIPPFGSTPLVTSNVNQRPWSISFLMNSASGSMDHSAWMFGRDTTTPGIGIDGSNYLFVRSYGISDFWYPRGYANTGSRWNAPLTTTKLDGETHSVHIGGGSPTFAFNREDLLHVAITYEAFKSASITPATSTDMGRMSFYVNGTYIGEQRKDISGHYKSGSFSPFTAIGTGYQSGNFTFGYSGSLGQVRLYNHVLSPDELNNLNKYPHLRANRDKKGHEIFTRTYGGVAVRSKQFQSPAGAIKTKNTVFSSEVAVGLPTSHSLEPADYRDDEFAGYTRKMYEGSKLTGPDWNINTTTTTDGGPVVSFTITNPNTLTSKEGNLKVQ